MTRLRIRVRPEQVMDQLDPQLAVSVAGDVEGVDRVELWDERAGDALYVTLDVHVGEPSRTVRDRLRLALAGLPGMDAFLVVEHGDQVPISEAADRDWEAAVRP